MGKFEEIAKICEDLINIDSPSGFTHNVMEYIKDYVENLGLNFEITKKGLGFCYQKEEENNLPIGVAVHVDTLGLMVRAINSDGTIKFTTVGGPILPTLDGEYCKIYNSKGDVFTGTIISTSSAIHVHKDARTIDRDENNMVVRLDEEVYTKEDVLNLGIQNGDYICYDPKFVVVNSFIKSRFLDDKVCVAQMLLMLKERVTQNKKTPIMYFSAHEEVGHGLAHVPMINKIDEMIAFDMGCVGDDLEGSETKVSICAKDSSGPYDYKMTQKFVEIAKANNIDFALDCYKFYGSDGSTSLRAGSDVPVALIGAGIHASHGMERANKKGLEYAYNLLDKYLDS